MNYGDPDRDALRVPLYAIPLPLAMRQASRIYAAQHERQAREALSIVSIVAMMGAVAALAWGVL